MESKQYYRNLAEMYIFERDAQLEPHKRLLLAKGVLYKMEDEMLSYQRKSGNSEKLIEANERLKILFDFIDNISSVLSDNTQLRLLLKDSMIERSNLEDMLVSLDKQLKFIEE
jgi:hypothetical protein